MLAYVSERGFIPQVIFAITAVNLVLQLIYLRYSFDYTPRMPFGHI